MAISDWKIEILSPYMSVKQTYTNASPGGIVSSINYSFEPSGNCLEASFQAIPAQVNITPRDLAKIYIDDMTVPKWYGYFRSHFNPDSNRVATYNLEGVKKLVYDYFLDEFFYNPTTGLTANGLAPHNVIVTALQSELPAFVTTTIDNQASTTTGNKPPIIANDYSLGAILDDISGSASDNEYVWGVYGTGQLFVKPENSTTLDFSVEPNKRVEYKTQGTDKVVTSVRYVFSVPNSFIFPTEYQQARNNGAKKDSFQPKKLTHTYTDSSATSTYSEFTKMQPLVLTDSWMKRYTAADIDALNTGQRVICYSLSEQPWATDTGSTDVGLFDEIVLNPDNSYIKNLQGAYESDTTTLYWNFFDGGAPIVIPGFVGLRIRYKAMVSGLSGFMSYQYEYEHTNINAAAISDLSLFSFELESGTEQDMFFVMPMRSLLDWKVDPDTLNTNGVPVKTLDDFQLQFTVDRIDRKILAADSIRVYEISPFFLNKDALDNVGKKFIKTPAQYPATVKLQQLTGLAKNITIDKTSGGTVTEEVKRISYELSRERGFEVTYDLGVDEQLDNTVFERLFTRDDKAEYTAFTNATGQV